MAPCSEVTSWIWHLSIRILCSRGIRTAGHARLATVCHHWSHRLRNMTKSGNMFYAKWQKHKRDRKGASRVDSHAICALQMLYRAAGLPVGNGLMKHVGVFLSVWRSHVLKHRASPYVAPTFLPDVYPAWPRRLLPALKARWTSQTTTRNRQDIKQWTTTHHSQMRRLFLMMRGRQGRITSSFPAWLYLTRSWNSQECIELFTEPDVVLVVAARPDISEGELPCCHSTSPLLLIQDFSKITGGWSLDQIIGNSCIIDSSKYCHHSVPPPFQRRNAHKKEHNKH